MKFKNQNQRKEFVENYKKWGLWFEVPELEMKYYRFILPDSTQIIVSEYKNKYYDYFSKTNKERNLVHYHLVVSDDVKWPAASYTAGNEFKRFSPNGSGISTIIKYLTDTKPEIEL